MKSKVLVISFLFLSCFIASIVSAGSFKVVPIRMFIDGGQKSAVFTVTNEVEERVTIQIGVKAWSQDENGKDIYQPSDELIVFPKIFTIDKKGGEQIVRVAFLGKTAPISKTEIAYRFFFEELPVKKPGETALMFALNMSIPVFIKPTQEAAGSAIEKVEFSAGALQVRVKNNGNAHLMAGKMIASGLGPTGASLFTKEASGWYVLAGASRVFPIPISKKECLPSKKMTVSVAIDKTTGSGPPVLTGETAVDPAQCAGGPLPVDAEKPQDMPIPAPSPQKETPSEKKKEK